DRTLAALHIFSGAFAERLSIDIGNLGLNPSDEYSSEELRSAFRGCYDAADLFLQGQDRIGYRQPLEATVMNEDTYD
ncbi:MAG: hypothetical protein IIC21_06190, partial [Chloroflexi bacterium]|nr:hypothetical protein [Chloroflexota bacterium]